MKIEVRDLRYRVGEKYILNGVNAVFDGPGICCIIGPNGCGKTTLLRHIYRQLPSRGTIFADGRDIASFSSREYARYVSVMMQHQDLTESELQVFDVIRTGRYPYKKLFSGYSREDDTFVERLMEENGMAAYRGRRIATLSGGELQRMMICRCFAQEPKVIVLDEPTNHLDIRYRIELMNALEHFHGLVIMTLHDLNLAARYAKCIYVMKDGSILAEGTPGEVFSPELLAEVFDVNIPVFREDGRMLVSV